MHTPTRRAPVQAVARDPRRLLVRWLTLLLALTPIMACTDDLDQRAVLPGEVIVRATPAGQPGARSSPTARTGGLTENVPPLPERQRIFFTRQGDLWQLPVNDGAGAVVTGRDILAFSASPTGEQVAVAVEVEGKQEFLLLNADGSTALRINPEEQPPLATGGETLSIAWSPQGSTIALSREDGSITVVNDGGIARQIVPPRAGARPGALSWSPDGRMLAFLDPSLPSQATSLWVVSREGGDLKRLVEAQSPSHSVKTMSWVPASHSIVYVQATPGAVGFAGDIFLMDVTNGRPRLLQPAGQFAPVAGAHALAVTADGSALAFTVFVPGEGRQRFHGLWLHDFESGRLTQISTAPGEAVADLWWAAGQLFYRAIPEVNVSMAGVYTGVEPFALRQIAPLQGSKTPIERYRSD